MNRVMLCSVVWRKMGKPRLSALIPHLEDGTYPNGFFLKPLPYSEEIRSEVQNNLKSFDDSETEGKARTAMSLIKSFTNPDFVVGSIRNPKLDTEWAAVEALALQRTDMEKIKDETMPPSHGVKRILDMDDD
uniref:ATP-dependent DNA helicase 2 subunit KU70 n=2 Tax=Cacopsylla melanoneura TaxID=428564 RepID=A0A8D8WHU0_9HEMI